MATAQQESIKADESLERARRLNEESRNVAEQQRILNESNGYVEAIAEVFKATAK